MITVREPCRCINYQECDENDVSHVPISKMERFEIQHRRIFEKKEDFESFFIG